MTQLGSVLDGLDRRILDGAAAEESLGKDSLMAVAQAELIDSEALYEEYLASVGSKIDREEGQQLVYTENAGFKMINAPQSLLLWARRQQQKPVCLVKPSGALVLQRAMEHLVEEQAEDLYKMAVLNLLMDSILWMVRHAKLGCKYCNRTAELQVMPALYHALKSSRLGAKHLAGEETYVAQRIADVLRLPGRCGQTHDVVIPKKMVRGLVQQIFKQKDFLNSQELSNSDYINRFSQNVAINAGTDNMVYSKMVLMVSIIIKNNPGAKE